MKLDQTQIDTSLENIPQKKIRIPNFLHLLLIANLFILLILMVRTEIQFVNLKNQIKLSLEEIKPTLDELYSKQDSLSSLPGINDRLSKVEENLLVTQKDLATIMGLLGNPSPDRELYRLISLYEGRNLNISFRCYDASTLTTIEACPVSFQIISIEPVTEWKTETQSNKKIVLPLRIRLSLNVNLEGYTPYLNLIEIIDDGNPQVIEIALSK